MNTFLFTNGSLNIIVFLATIMALITQFNILKIIPPILGFEDRMRMQWHRRLGWIALGGFVLNRLISLFLSEYPAYPLEPQDLIHSVLIAFCAAAIVIKIWRTQPKAMWDLKRFLTWGGKFFILGAFFTTFTCSLIAWRWANPITTWDKNDWLFYQIAILGHVGLAIVLIWLGRMALTNRYEINKINALIDRNTTRWSKIKEIFRI